PDLYQMDVANSEGHTSQISVCVLSTSSSDLEGLLNKTFDPDHYLFTFASTADDFLQLCSKHCDCAIIEDPAGSSSLFQSLEQAFILLPAVLLTSTPSSLPQAVKIPQFFYHPAEIKVAKAKLERELMHAVCQAIANFVRLAAIARADKRESFQAWFSQPSLQRKLMQQQIRLSEKLRERLGYLGVYYKRDPQQFIRNLEAEERQELTAELKRDYRLIILSYFRGDEETNSMLDAFVTKSFFADVSITWILEMHMELMDVFAKKLKLEGRSDDVLLDYRLTLIDAIAHLAEMYRLSIPREA
ncbi:MAG: circadian clock protein KaiA, partial [Cyanobacteria bacterium P01_F01_bin.42]